MKKVFGRKNKCIMKRSEFIIKLRDIVNTNIIYEEQEIDLDQIERVLDVAEQLGMKPPSVPSKVIKGSNYPFGGGCSMRCSCPECNPDYPVNEWEKE